MGFCLSRFDQFSRLSEKGSVRCLCHNSRHFARLDDGAGKNHIALFFCDR